MSTLKQVYESESKTIRLFPHPKAFVLPEGARSHSIDPDTGELTGLFEYEERRLSGDYDITVRAKTDRPAFNIGVVQMFWTNRDPNDPVFLRRIVQVVANNNFTGGTFNGFHAEMANLLSQIDIPVMLGDFVPRGNDTRSQCELEKLFVKIIREKCPEDGYKFTVVKSKKTGTFFFQPVRVGASLEDTEKLADVGETTDKAALPELEGAW